MRNNRKKLWGKIRVYLGFPQIWLFAIISVMTIVVFFLSRNLDDEYLQSLFSNIFAGFVTGLVLSLLTGTRQIYFSVQERKIKWLNDLHKLITDYFELHHKFLRNDFNGMDRDDFIYEMGASVSWVGEHVLQSSFDRRLPINTEKYCRKHFEFDAITFYKEVEELRESICNNDHPAKNDVVELFRNVDRKLHLLNRNVFNEIKNTEIKIATAQRSVV